MLDLLNKYLQFLMSNPSMINSIILWTMTMTTVWIIQFKYRKLMIAGMSGANGFMEAAEQVAYILNWVWPPIVCFSAFFDVALPVWVWYFITAGVAYTVGGRWLFEWVLALRAGSTKVETTTTEKTELKQSTETKTENSNEKINS